MLVSRSFESAGAHRLDCENHLERLDHYCIVIVGIESVELDQVVAVKWAGNPKGLDQRRLWEAKRVRWF